MPKFNCSYAYDVSCYFDFTVEAKDAEEAQAKIDKAFKDGVFGEVSAEPCFEAGIGNERVVVSEETTDKTGAPTLEEVIEKAPTGCYLE